MNVFVEQPLALPGSAKYTVTDTHTLRLMDSIGQEADKEKIDCCMVGGTQRAWKNLVLLLWMFNVCLKTSKLSNLNQNSLDNYNLMFFFDKILVNKGPKNIYFSKNIKEIH